MYLFFDTETTGLPKSRLAPVTDVDNWPRMVQLAWLLYDENKKELNGQSYIIRPEGFTIPEESSRIHGITTEKALHEGVTLDSALFEFTRDLEEARHLIAHNISFDENIIGAELLRKRLNSRLWRINKVCTMLTTTEYCAIPGQMGYKWPTLTELHNKLFNKPFSGAHDALADVKACARCFFELKESGLINI